MRNIMVIFMLSILFLSSASVESQEDEAVYIHDINPHLFVGPIVCEFAINGDINILRMVEPYIFNNRLYFTGLALPVNAGSLRSGFEFNLDLFEDDPRIVAIYQGSPGDPVLKQHEEDGLLVAGYAQQGSIVITHVFFDTESADRWTNTVRLASD